MSFGVDGTIHDGAIDDRREWRAGCVAISASVAPPQAHCDLHRHRNTPSTNPPSSSQTGNARELWDISPTYSVYSLCFSSRSGHVPITCAAHVPLTGRSRVPPTSPQQICPCLINMWASSARFGHSMPKFGRLRPILGQHCATLAKFWPDSAGVGHVLIELVCMGFLVLLLGSTPSAVGIGLLRHVPC